MPDNIEQNVPQNFVDQDEAFESLFSEENGESSRGSVLAWAGLGIAALGGIYTSHRLGVGIDDVNDLFDRKFVPEPAVVTEIVDGFVLVNETLRGAAPAVMLGGLAVQGSLYVKSRQNGRSRTLNELSTIDYSGVDAAQGENGVNHSFRGRATSRVKKFGAGVGLAAFTVLLTGGSSGVENEVSNGPLRPVSVLFDELSVSDNPSLILQSEDLTFMGDSYMRQDSVVDFANLAAESNISVVPFNKSLPDIGGRSGMVISLPDEVFEGRTGVEVEIGCDTLPIVLDNASQKQPGETISINNLDAQIVAKMDGMSQMNRDVALMSQTDMVECLQNTDDPLVFGAIVSGADSNEIDKVFMNSELAGESSLISASHISQEKFEGNNRKFWRANGTPILLQMIAYVGAFGAFATGSERRSAMQRNIREIGILNAQGVSMKDIKGIERRRALRDTAKATVLAAPLMPVFVGAFNAAEVGLKVGVGVREVAVGYSVTLAAKLAGGTRAVRAFSKKLNLSDSVKG